MRLLTSISMLMVTVEARLSSKKHFDMAVARKEMGVAAFDALNKDARCATKQPIVSTRPIVATQPSRCLELCQGKPECVSVCNEVRTMICDAHPVVVGVSSSDSAAAASAAAAAATAAVRDAVKDAINEATTQSKKAADETQAALKNAMAEATAVAKKAAKES